MNDCYTSRRAVYMSDDNRTCAFDGVCDGRILFLPSCLVEMSLDGMPRPSINLSTD